jgi:hypothetical protein
MKWPNVPEPAYLTISHIDITNVASVSVALYYYYKMHAVHAREFRLKNHCPCPVLKESA